jgi:hypothetical protein
MPALHVHELEPSARLPMLAVHGVTGHGARWRSLAAGTRVLQEAYVRPELVEGLRLCPAGNLALAGLNGGHQRHLERGADVAEIVTGFLADG